MEPAEKSDFSQLWLKSRHKNISPRQICLYCFSLIIRRLKSIGFCNGQVVLMCLLLVSDNFIPKGSHKFSQNQKFVTDGFWSLRTEPKNCFP